MYVIIWEYQISSNRIAEFEQTYNPQGAWAALFKKGKGYIGTELFRDETHLHRYITIDRWKSVKDYEAFLIQFKEEYEVLDAQWASLMEKEMLFGKWETR